MRQYIDLQGIADEFCVSKQTAKRIADEMDALTGLGKRYGPYTFRGEGKTFQVRYAAVDDYMRYRSELTSPDSAKYVPGFDIREAEMQLGVSNMTIVKIDAQEVADLVFRKLAAAIGKAV